MKTRHWMWGLAVFTGILAMHIALGSNRLVSAAKMSGFVQNVGASFDMAVGKALPTSENAGRAPASVPADVKAVELN